MSLQSEIHEQPALLRGFLSTEWPHVTEIAAEIRRCNIDYIFLAARGTCDHATRYANYLLGAFNHLPVVLLPPDLS